MMTMEDIWLVRTFTSGFYSVDIFCLLNFDVALVWYVFMR